MKKLTFAALALGLVIAGCGEKNEGETPKPTNKSGPNITQAPTPKKEFDAKETLEKTHAALQQLNAQLKPAPKGSADWKPASQAAAAVATTAESHLASLRKVSGTVTTQVNIQGDVGLSFSQIAILDPKQFYLEYPRMSIVPKPNLTKEVLVGNGANYATNALSSSGWSDSQPVTALRRIDASNLQDWAIKFPRTIFSALQGGKPLSNLLAEARKEGLQTAVETRTITRDGRSWPQYRILLSRPAKVAEAKGNLTYEIIVDGHYRLPVTIRTAIEPKKGKPTMVMWTIRWNLDQAQKIDRSVFTIPPKVAKTSSA